MAITRRNNYRGLTHLYALYAQDLKTGEEIRITSPITGTGDFILTTIQNLAALFLNAIMLPNQKFTWLI